MKCTGHAKSFFQLHQQRSPWNQSPCLKSFDWPFIKKLLDKKSLAYFDFTLARCLSSQEAEQEGEVDQKVILFLCYLILASRSGHLCISLSSDTLSPAIHQLWQPEQLHFLSNKEIQYLQASIYEGSKLLPSRLVTRAGPLLTEGPPTPIYQEENYFYLQKHWLSESLFLHHFHAHLATGPKVAVDCQTIKKEIEQMVNKGLLNQEQAAAIEQACLSSILFIVGGPGTGKSYTAAKLVQLLHLYRSNQEAKFEIILAAPTGKAAANLQKNFASLQERLDLQVKTLHALLGIKQTSSFYPTNPLTADLIVVDECSMIDAEIMVKLFQALKPGARLVMLGDPDQLAPVGVGNLFNDLIRLAFTHPFFAKTLLKKCLRTELKSILDFAEEIKKGNAKKALKLMDPSTKEITRLQLGSSLKDAQKKLVSYIVSLFASYHHDWQEADLMQAFNQLRLLSPLRQGPLGVEKLNQLIWSEISQKEHQSKQIAVPITISINDYHQDLFNGDTGVLIRKLPLGSFLEKDYALFFDRKKNSVKKIPFFCLPKYELAYCLSVHKSQGSEFDKVVLVLPEGSELFGRNMLYTAITRARKSIEIWGNDLILQKTIENVENRLSTVEIRSARFAYLSNQVS